MSTDPVNPSSESTETPTPAEKPLVLVVDDEESILRSIKRLLRKCDCRIELATCGADALVILEEQNVAVIVCDQRMPEMTGAEVLERSVKISPETFRITLTGYTDLASAQKSINQGQINHFLCKPWDDEVLTRVVEEGLDAFRLKREHRELQALTKRQRDELQRWNMALEEIGRASCRERV